MAAMEANIFKLDNSTVDVLKLISEMWRNRSNESLIRGLAETLIPFVVEKRTLCEIEFYLPQLASLILYLEAQTASSQAMEYLAIAISQASINCAVQLTNYFAAAMEDFQPELATGAINPKANQALYYRAARLFQNVQRAVVYGSPVLTSEQERFMMQQFSQATLDEMFDSEKTEAAGRIVRSNLGKGVKMGASDGKSGRLYFKAASGSWSQFFCKVDQRVLFFFKDNMANAMPVRCVPLDACEVSVVQNPAQPYTFTVTPRGLPTTTLRASEQSDMTEWVRFLNGEATSPPTGFTDSPITEGQFKRYLYWTQIKTFMSALVGISERVRQRPPECRKFYLRKYLSDLVVPPLSYAPWQQSLDSFRYILKTQPCESTVGFFATGSPCYVIMETEKHAQGLDLASFLGKELQEYTDEMIRAPVAPPPTDLMLDRPSAEEDGSVEQPKLLTSLLDVSVRTYWKTDGSGMDGLDERFVTPTPGKKGRESIEPPHPDTVIGNTAHAEINSSEKRSPHSTSQICNTFMLRFREFETLENKAARMRNSSPAGHLHNWALSGLTAMSNIDARQEALVSQLITYYQKAFEVAGLPVWMKCSKSVPVGKTASISDFAGSAYSLASIKQHCDYPGSLQVYFEKAFGGTSDAPQHKIALDNFIGSMAAYSVVCYLLGIRGRNEDVVLLDSVGHVIHQDFSSIFKSPSVSTPLMLHDAHFILSPDMVAVMNGRFSPEFATYASLCGQCMLEARRHLPVVKTLLEIAAETSDLPSLKPPALEEFVKRHIMGTPDFSVEYEFNFLIERSITCWK